MSTTIDNLIQASHRALGGPNPTDAWLAYGIPCQDAVVFTRGWVAELRSKAVELGVDTDYPDFVHHLVLGALQVGIEYGRTIPRHSRPSAPPSEA